MQNNNHNTMRTSLTTPNHPLPSKLKRNISSRSHPNMVLTKTDFLRLSKSHTTIQIDCYPNSNNLMVNNKITYNKPIITNTIE